MSATLAQLYRYPVKGLSPQALDATDLTAGAGLPGDRRYALALASAPIDRDDPAWMPKTNFLALMRNASLAALATDYDEAAERLTIRQGGQIVLEAILKAPEGRDAVEAFFAAYMGGEIKGRPRLVRARTGDFFGDHFEPDISLINLASVRDLEPVVGTSVDPLRFRGNLYIDGVPAWSELEWVDRTLTIGDVQMTVTQRTERCAATNVDPDTGRRDLNIPKSLNQTFGHIDCGIQARVTVSGRIAVGQTLTLEV